jgi:hypothetical protein
MVALVMSAGAALLGAFFAYMYGLKRQHYLLAWSGAWVLVAVQSLGRGFDASQNLTSWQELLNEWLMAAAALVFLCSVQLYSRRPARFDSEAHLSIQMSRALPPGNRFH